MIVSLFECRNDQFWLVLKFWIWATYFRAMIVYVGSSFRQCSPACLKEPRCIWLQGDMPQVIRIAVPVVKSRISGHVIASGKLINQVTLFNYHLDAMALSRCLLNPYFLENRINCTTPIFCTQEKMKLAFLHWLGSFRAVRLPKNIVFRYGCIKMLNAQLVVWRTALP